MPDNKVILVRGDGSTLEATPEQASRLSLLGYQPQTTEQGIAQDVATGRENYYTSAGQKLTAAAEGLGAGATFGATDYLFGDDETKQRAAYNPGTRLATETLGALAPLLLSGGESAAATGGKMVEEAGALGKVAAKAPTSLLSDAAHALAPGAEGSLTKAVSKGILEGGVYGGTSAADRAYLDGDPVTAEAVLHGIGWGAIAGGALSAAGHAISAVGEYSSAPKELEQVGIPSFEQIKSSGKDFIEQTIPASEIAKRGYFEPVGGHTDAARSEAAAKAIAEGQREPVTLSVTEGGRIVVNDGRHRLNAAIEADAPIKVKWSTGFEPSPSDVPRAGAAPKIPHGALENTSGSAYRSLHSEISALADSAAEANAAADATVKGTIDSLLSKGQFSDLAQFEHGEVGFVRDVKKSGKLYEAVTSAVDSGKFEAAQTAAKEYAAHVSDVAKRLGVDMPNPAKSLEDLISLRAVASEISKMPNSVQGFASLGPAKLERVLAAIEKVKDLPLPQVQVVSQAATDFSKSLGIEGDNLRGTWKAAKQLYKQEGKAPKAIKPTQPSTPTEDQSPSFLRKAAGYLLGGKAYVAARAAGFGKAGSFVAYRSVKDAITNGGSDLAAARASTLSRISTAAKAYFPKAGKALEAAAPRVEPLTTTLFGQKDTSTKDRKQLAMNRIKEINDFGPTAGDTLFRAVEPLSITQPKLAPALHSSMLQSFQALQNMVPKDPGVISKLQSIWKPSDVHAIVLSRQLEVFHDPVGSAEYMLSTGKFDPVRIEALKELAPNTWQDLRVNLLARITDPAVRDKLSYHDQIGLSTMLDIPIHSSMAPEYIATSQQMFLDRNQPLKANPTMGQGGGMPNPSDSVNATSSQKNEAH